MNKYTDEQLKRALAKMLPGKLSFKAGDASHISRIEWLDETNPKLLGIILDTELLQLCWEVEETLTDNESDVYGLMLRHSMALEESKKLSSICDWHAAWRQRIPALTAVKGITI